MKRLCIIGGETHMGDVLALHGKQLEIVAAAVREDQTDWAEKMFGCRACTDWQRMLEDERPDLVAVAGENDKRAEAVIGALRADCDLIVDKPLALTEVEQDAIEDLIAQNPSRRLMVMFTLRGHGSWRAVREAVLSGRVGDPVLAHVRMAVRMKRDQRPPWFLDARRSGGLFLDLLIHGLDQIEWLTGQKIMVVTARMGNIGHSGEPQIIDHASAYCELQNGATALVEGQRLLPDTLGSDYRAFVAGTKGFADLQGLDGPLLVTDDASANTKTESFGDRLSTVEDWLAGGDMITQAESLRSNRLALAATRSAREGVRVEVSA